MKAEESDGEAAPVRALVVLPTYQEGANIDQVLRCLRSVAPSIDVLVVDDSSPDGTAEVAKAVAHELGGIDVLVRAGKSGLGSAYRDGIGEGLARGYTVIAEMDSDLSHDPARMPALVQAVVDGADLALGSRYVPGGSIPHWPFHRRWLSLWGNRYASWSLGLPVRDATTGFRAFRADVLRRIDLPSVRSDGYGFQIETVYRVLHAGGRIVELPIQFVDRERGESKMSFHIIAEALLRVTWWGSRARVRRLRAVVRSRATKSSAE